MKYAIIFMGLLRFDTGTKCKLSTECRLVRENSQWLRIIDLSIKPKMSRLNFFDRFGCAIRTRRSTIQFFVKFGSVIYQI